MMRTPTKTNLRAEAIVQAFAIVPILLMSFLFLTGINENMMPFAALLFAMLGVFQLVTAFIRVIRHGSVMRWNFLILFAGYVFSLILGDLLYPPRLPDLFIGIVIIGVPAISAFTYWILTILQCYDIFKDKSRPILTRKKPIEETEKLKEIEDDDLLIQEIKLRQKERILNR